MFNKRLYSRKPKFPEKSVLRVTYKYHINILSLFIFSLSFSGGLAVFFSLFKCLIHTNSPSFLPCIAFLLTEIRSYTYTIGDQYVSTDYDGNYIESINVYKIPRLKISVHHSKYFIKTLFVYLILNFKCIYHINITIEITPSGNLVLTCLYMFNNFIFLIKKDMSCCIKYNLIYLCLY